MKRSEIMLLGLMLLMALVLPACAQDNGDNENISKLIVQGEGKVFAAPDMVTIVLGVETRNASAAGAVAENAMLMSNTTNALLEAGIEEKDIQTSTYSLTTMPEEKPPEEAGRAEDEEIRPPEFIATNRVTVRLNNTEDVGRVLDAAVAAGTNNIQGISFDLRDPAPEKDRALTMAIEDASRKAGVAASAAGVELGRIMEISEGFSFVSARSEVAFSLAAPTTPIQPGELEVTSSVTMTYEIS